MTNETNTPTQSGKIIEISYNKALGIIAGAILTAMVGTAFTVARILNTDHFTIIALDSRMDTYETTVNQRLDSVEKKIDYLIDIHLKRQIP